MGYVQPQAEIRFSTKNANGSRDTHIIDQGGNYKLNGRIMNPKEPKYSDDIRQHNGKFVTPLQRHKLRLPLISSVYPPVPKNPRIVEKTGKLESFVYFDRDVHKTVRMKLVDGEYHKIIL